MEMNKMEQLHDDSMASFADPDFKIDRKPLPSPAYVCDGIYQNHINSQTGLKPETPPETLGTSSGEEEKGQSTEKDETPAANDRLGMPTMSIVVSLALSFTIFLIGLDMTLVSVALPRITEKFGGLGDVGWYGSCYFLAAAASQLVFGALNRFTPHKYVFLFGVFLFELGCLISGLATSAVMCIIGRTISGLGSSGVASTSYVLITQIIPEGKLAVMIGILGSMELFGQILGPLLGGVFTDAISWRWCFLINVPSGGVSGVIVFLLLRDKTKKSQPWSEIWDGIKSVDRVGILIMVPAVTLFLLVVQLGGTVYPWRSAPIIAMAVLGGLLFGVLFWWERRLGDRAAIPFSLFRNRSIPLAVVFAFSHGSANAIFDYYIPLWNQTVQEKSAYRAGVLLLPLNVCSAVSVIIGGALSNIIGYLNPVMLAGGVMTAFAGGFLSAIDRATSESTILGLSALCGLGSMAVQQPVVAAKVHLSDEMLPTGISVMLFSILASSAVGLAIAQATFFSGLDTDLRAVPGVNGEEIFDAGATDLREIVEPSVLPQVLQIYNHSLTITFFISTAGGILMVLTGLFVKWKKSVV